MTRTSAIPRRHGAYSSFGATGPAGKVELITCKTISKRIKGHVRKRQKCTGRLVSGMVSFTLAGTADRATISRGQVVYATGASASTGRGRAQMVLNDLRPLRRGSYTLTLTTGLGHRRLMTRRTIIIN